MSLALLAAAATVFDDIEDVAHDARLNVGSATNALHKYGLASVSSSGRVTMSDVQSMRAARAIDLDERPSHAAR